MDHIIRLLIFYAGLSYMIQGIVISPKNISVVSLEAEPCSIKDSFVFSREDAKTGSVLMKLPKQHGERWALTETGSVGYLVLDNTGEDISQIVFAQSPDIEAIREATDGKKTTLPFVLYCRYGGWRYKYRQELIIDDVNEHPPVFDMSRSYNMTISESSSVGSNVFSLRHVAKDPDVTGRIAGYSLMPYQDPECDGIEYFRVSDDENNVVLAKPVDFDELYSRGQTYFKLNLTATDTGIPTPLSSYITLTIYLTDVDDQPPAFVYPDCPMADNFCALPYFHSVIKCGYKGIIRMYPGPIVAIDRDRQNHSIVYTITKVDPEKYTDKFKMEKNTGQVTVTRSSCASSVDEILLTITATEVSPLQHSISTTLQVELLDNLVIPNMAWDVKPGIEQDFPGNIEEDAPNSTTLSMTFFLLAVFGFLAIGTVLTVVAVRVSRNKKKNKINTSPNFSHAYADDYGDCRLCRSDLSPTVTCFRSCSTKENTHSPASSIHSESLRAKLAPYLSSSCESHSEVDSLPPQAGFLPEMKTAFTSNTVGPFLLDDGVQFQPNPTLPGLTDTSGFYDSNTSFGSMKHERGVHTLEEDDVGVVGTLRKVGRFKIKFTSAVPELFKSVHSKVRFDTSNQSSV